MAAKVEKVVLPDAVLPIRYELWLAPDLKRFSFDGRVSIEVEVSEATSEVQLHSRELQVKTAVFKPVDGAAVDVECISYDMKDHIVTFTFSEVLPVGKGTLEISYLGELNNQMAGFYRSGYKDIHGVEKIMASTQFESLDARRCFPCWDEPARKAVFAVTLVVDDPTLTAFSNMPEKSSRLVKADGKVTKEIVFMDSPKMSTYLVAFVVGEFDFVQSKTDHGVLVRVYTPPGRSEAGRFALDVATKALDIYDDFFGLPYPLPKLDMVAIPEFAMGAMENWGLVTYREVDLLIDMKTASRNQMQRVCIVVTHELAHQWFGNLVTMEWWDDLWLNEGFASWCENYAADLIFPDYQMWEQFGTDTVAAALGLDCLKSSHPIQVPIGKAEEVEEVFDAISYCKGASVIRMARGVLGADNFKKGLQQYMQRHQYSNTVTSDLWSAWGQASGLPVKDIMASWTEQMGFPQLTVKSFEVISTGPSPVARMQLEQTWFLSSGETPPEEKTWQVPLFFSSKAGTPPKPTMMSEKNMVLEVPLTSADDDHVLLNAGGYTPMRVCYNAEMRRRLVIALKAGLLQPCDRAALVMDTYNLAKAGKLGADEALRFLIGFQGERHYVVWDALSMVFMGFKKNFMGGAPAEVYKLFMETVEQFVWNGWLACDLGWTTRDSDGHLDGLLRGTLMSLVSTFANGASFMQEATRRFAKYVEDPSANATDLPDEYRVAVFRVILRSSGPSEYQKLMECFKKLTANVDEKHVMQAIGYTSDAKLKMEALRWAISGSVKLQDFAYVMGSVASSSREGLDMTWGFVKSDFDSIRKLTKDASASIMDHVIQVATGGYCTEDTASEIEQFFEAHPLPQNKRTIAQTLEGIRSNAGFVQRALATDVAKAAFWKELQAVLSADSPPGARL